MEQVRKTPEPQARDPPLLVKLKVAAVNATGSKLKNKSTWDEESLKRWGTGPPAPKWQMKTTKFHQQLGRAQDFAVSFTLAPITSPQTLSLICQPQWPCPSLVFLCSGVLKGHLTYFRERDREKVYLKGINKVVEMEREIGRKDKTRDTAHPISFLSGAELWKSVWQALTPPGDVERAEWWLLNDFPRNLDRLLASPQFSCVLRTTPRPLWGSGLSVEMFPLGLMQPDLCFL